MTTIPSLKHEQLIWAGVWLRIVYNQVGSHSNQKTSSSLTTPISFMMVAVLNSAMIGCRAEAAMIAALLHDVLDDTSVKADQIEEQFGSEVASMVAKVSQLSSMNQLLRRRRRQLVRPSITTYCYAGVPNSIGWR